MALYRRGRVWWAEWWDADGNRHRESLSTPSKALAYERYAKLIGTARAQREGRWDPAAAAARQPLAEHLAAWQDALRTVSKQHREELTLSLARYAKHARAAWLSDLTRDSGEAFLRHLASPPYSLGARTVNKHRAHLAQFGGWLVETERLPRNPFAALGRMDESQDARHVRRPLTPEEVDRLRRSPRAAVYMTALATGLRRAELRALRWEDVDLEAGTVTVRRASAKNRREVALPIPPEVVGLLRDLHGQDAARALSMRARELARSMSQAQAAAELGMGRGALRRILEARTPTAAAPCDRVFAAVPRCQTLRADLGLPDSAEGPCVDFHSLRVSCATMMAARGVPLTTAQRFLRHSDPRLTANVYTKVNAEDLRAASAAVWGQVWGHDHASNRHKESYGPVDRGNGAASLGDKAKPASG